MQPGKYVAKAQDVGLGMTDTGKEQIGILFEVVEGESAGEVVTWRGYFTEKTAQRTIESLRHCGWQGDDLSTLTVDDLPANVQIVVDEEEYDGSTYTRVKWVNRLGAGLAMKSAMDASSAKSFAARFRGLCAATPKQKPAPAPTPTNGTRPPAAAPPMREPGADEDIPNW